MSKMELPGKNKEWDKFYDETGTVLIPTRKKGIFWAKQGGNWEVVEVNGTDEELERARFSGREYRL